MPLALQVKVLRALRDRNMIERLGSDRGVALDIRVVAAATKVGSCVVRRARVQVSDYYYRPASSSWRIPPLRGGARTSCCRSGISC